MFAASLDVWSVSSEKAISQPLTLQSLTFIKCNANADKHTLRTPTQSSGRSGAVWEWAGECCWILKSCMTGPFLLTAAKCSHWSPLMCSIAVYTQHSGESVRARKCVCWGERWIIGTDGWDRMKRKRRERGRARQLALILTLSQASIDISFS